MECLNHKDTLIDGIKLCELSSKKVIVISCINDKQSGFVYKVCVLAVSSIQERWVDEGW